MDPAHFTTAPSLSWSAFLKLTKVKLELMIDPDMSMFIDKSLIGVYIVKSHTHMPKQIILSVLIIILCLNF